jgi:hypothetical protein
VNAGHLVIGYHGCDAVVRDDLVSGRLAGLTHSANPYDWLGPGAYFFEGDPERALNFAEASRAHPEKMYTKQPIVTPAVVGAVLRIHNWLDMTTQHGIREFSFAHDAMLKALAANGEAPPRNVPARDDDADILLRRLDNAVFTHLHTVREKHLNVPAYQAVRGAFPQGPAIAENSGFRRDSHIQIAVRDDACVVGWFMPPGLKLLAQDVYEELAGELTKAKAAAGAARKPRVRARR